MPWVGFATRAAWTTFHDAVCSDMGIPRPGKRTSDDVVQINNQWTEAAFVPIVLDVVINGNPRKIGILLVPPVVVTRYNLASNVISDPSNNGDGTYTVTYNGNQYVVALAPDETNFPFRRPRPPTWTDPDTGIIYNT